MRGWLPIDPRPVKSCLCYPHTFEELKVLASENGWSDVSEITAATGCGSGCGLCRPYIERMLETGDTEFAIITSHQTRPFRIRQES